jgi:tetratricopeptide (TPR) repeat protein
MIIDHPPRRSVRSVPGARSACRARSARRVPGAPGLFLALAALALLAGGLAACTAAGSEEEAIRRGDAAFARGDFGDALAEYRLAIRQGSDRPETWLRAAHAFARVNRIDEAREHYEAAIARDPSLADQAASDLLRVSRRAVDRRDGMVASAAADAAIRLVPGVSLSGVALDLARHYIRASQPAEALTYYQKALAENAEDPEILLELALAHEQLGDCERALAHFERVRPRVAANRRSEVDWQVGNCSFQLAREAQLRGLSEEALGYFRTVTELGEPRNVLGQAWFETGEILARRGECTAATAAFERVIQAEGGSGALAARARDRVDQIRFRRGGEGPC